jgi:hypothetical protein
MATAGAEQEASGVVVTLEGEEASAVVVTLEAEEASVVVVTLEAAAEVESASAERASPVEFHFDGGGPRPSSFGTRPSHQQPVYSGPVSRSVTPSVRGTTATLNRQQNHFASPINRAAQLSHSAVATPSDPGILSARNHVFGRHDGNWRRDWDRRHAHFRNGHWWFFDGGTWIGLDAGYYPWDYYPYSAADQQADPTVSAVQSRLAKLGYYNGVVDGLFGPDTRAALTRYQIDHRLSVTASLTKDTLQSLGIQKIATS